MGWIGFIVLGIATILISTALIYLLAAEMTHRSQNSEETRLGSDRTAAGVSRHN